MTKVKELFGGKYEVLMVEDVEGDEEGMAMREVGPVAGAASGPRGARTNLGPRVAFQIVPAAQVRVLSVRAGGMVGDYR